MDIYMCGEDFIPTDGNFVAIGFSKAPISPMGTKKGKL